VAGGEHVTGQDQNLWDYGSKLKLISIYTQLL